jgi:ubiquinol-cytochrome c reductase cytochrome c1 subunit
MPPALIVDEMVEYEDGTVATKSQMAKDVTHFLTWTSDRNHDDRKRQGIFYVSSVFALMVMTGIWKRYKFLPLKNELSYWKS